MKIARTMTVASTLALIAGAVAIARPADQNKPTSQPEFKLPEGWTEADMQRCMEAATPGKMHEVLAKGVGTWRGKTTMWMSPGADPVTGECVSVVTPVMDGRFYRVETKGDMGMGPMTGEGTFGYDNVSKQFVSSWITSCGTGFMQGTGELSSDGTTLTWTSTMNCPVAGKPTTIRDVERHIGADTTIIESYAKDPKSGKEFKMMQMELTRQR